MLYGWSFSEAQITSSYSCDYNFFIDYFHLF